MYCNHESNLYYLLIIILNKLLLYEKLKFHEIIFYHLENFLYLILIFLNKISLFHKPT